MISLTFCLRRRAHLTHDAFLDYWYNKHALLVQKHAEALRIRRYIQHHGLDHPINHGIGKPRNAPEPYDGIAELWFDSAEDMAAGATDPAARAAGKALLEDENKFIELSQSPIWINHPRSVIG